MGASFDGCDVAPVATAGAGGLALSFAGSAPPFGDAERSLHRSHEELRELSANLLNIREEEKSRIARELHDDLGQQLTALKMDISSLELSAGTDADARTQLRGMERPQRADWIKQHYDELMKRKDQPDSGGP